MKSAESWKPTKFIERRGDWRANPDVVPPASRLITDRVARTYAEALGSHASGRLLDLGCGSVPLYGMYRDTITEAVCVDWGETRHDARHVDLFADLNEPLQLAPDSFDTVVATDVIEHLRRPQALFETAAQVLRPGGKLVLGAPFLYWIHEAPHDFQRLTRYALAALAAEHGLSVIRLAPYGGAPEVLADLSAKILGASRWFGGRTATARLFYHVGAGMLRARPLRALSAATREQMPLGYILVATKAGPGRARTASDSKAGAS